MNIIKPVFAEKTKIQNIFELMAFINFVNLVVPNNVLNENRSL